MSLKALYWDCLGRAGCKSWDHKLHRQPLGFLTWHRQPTFLPTLRVQPGLSRSANFTTFLLAVNRRQSGPSFAMWATHLFYAVAHAAPSCQSALPTPGKVGWEAGRRNLEHGKGSMSTEILAATAAGRMQDAATMQEPTTCKLTPCRSDVAHRLPAGQLCTILKALDVLIARQSYQFTGSKQIRGMILYYLPYSQMKFFKKKKSLDPTW